MKLEHISEKLFTLFFGRKSGVHTERLLKQLRIVSLGTGIAGFLYLLFAAYAARRIGPASFGTYTLIAGIANTMLLPMLFGLHTAATHHIARARQPHAIISTVLLLVGLLTLGTVLVVFAIGSLVFDLFFIPHKLLVPSMLLAIVLTFGFLGDAILRGLGAMKHLAVLRTMQSLIFAIVLIVALQFRSGAITPYLALFAGACVFLIGSFWFIRTYVTRPQPAMFSDLIHYGFYAFLGSIAGSLFEVVDKLLLNRFVNTDTVGLYAAYTLLSVTLSGKLLSLLMVVLFPFFSSNADHQLLFSKFNRLVHRAGLYLFSVVLLLLLFIPFFYGPSYRFSFPLALLFAVAAALYFMVWGRLWLVSATGIAGVRIVAITALGAVVLNMVLNLLFIPQFQATGAAAAAVGTLLSLYAVVPMLQRRVIRTEDP